MLSEGGLRARQPAQFSLRILPVIQAGSPGNGEDAVVQKEKTQPLHQHPPLCSPRGGWEGWGSALGQMRGWGALNPPETGQCLWE